MLALTSAGTANAQQITRLDVSASHSHLSGAREGWREASLALSFSLPRDWVGIARLDHSERFGLIDDYAELRAETHNGRGYTYFALGGALDAEFRPAWALKAGLSRRVGDRWSILADADHSGFAGGNVLAMRAGVERRFEWADATAQVFAVGVADSDVNSHGYGLRVEAQAIPRLRFRAGYTDAPETSEGTITEVESWTLAGMFEVSDALSLRLDVTVEDRGDYRRSELAAGAAWQF